MYVVTIEQNNREHVVTLDAADASVATAKVRNIVLRDLPTVGAAAVRSVRHVYGAAADHAAEDRRAGRKPRKVDAANRIWYW